MRPGVSLQIRGLQTEHSGAQQTPRPRSTWPMEGVYYRARVLGHIGPWLSVEQVPPWVWEIKQGEGISVGRGAVQQGEH